MTLASAESTIQTRRTAIARSARPRQRGIVAGGNVAIGRGQPVRTLPAAVLRHSNLRRTWPRGTRTTSKDERFETIGFAICAGCVTAVTTRRIFQRRSYQPARGDRSSGKMSETRDLRPNEDRMLHPQPPERSTLYDVVCQTCSHHQVTRRAPTSCAKCSSLQISVLPATGTVMTR